MNALVYEHTERHRCLIGDCLCTMLSREGFSPSLARSLPDAQHKLSLSPQIVVVHHDGFFSDIVALRSKVPQAYFIAYSGLFVLDAPETSLAGELVTKSRAHYNELLEQWLNLPHSLDAWKARKG